MNSKLKGEGGGGGVPWVKIMENELECLGDRKGHDGHLAKQVLKKILFLARVIVITLSRFGCRY